MSNSTTWFLEYQFICKIAFQAVKQKTLPFSFHVHTFRLPHKRIYIAPQSDKYFLVTKLNRCRPFWKMASKTSDNKYGDV